MKPEDVDPVLAANAACAIAFHRGDGHVFQRDHGDYAYNEEARAEYLKDARAALAVVLPAHKQSVTAKYRRFVKEVREITRHGESMQTPKSEGGFGDECVISPPELRQALTDLRHGRQ